MNTKTTSVAIAILIFCAWMTQLVPLITTSISSNEIVAKIEAVDPSGKKPIHAVEVDAQSKAAVRDLDEKRLLSWVLVILGIGASLMALLRLRFWRLAVMATSVSYLVVWIIFGSLGDMAPWTAMQLKWMAAKTLNYEGDFFLRDVILPITYFLVAMWLLVSVAIDRGRSAQS